MSVDQVEECDWDQCVRDKRQRKVPFILIKDANQSRALNIASIQDLTGEFYVWEEPAYLKPVEGIRKVSLAPVVKGQSRFWTNSVEIAKALKTETGNVNENIARAIERQVEERERE